MQTQQISLHKKELDERGFTILKGVFSESELAPVRKLTDEIIDYAEKELEDPFRNYFLRHRADQGALYDLFCRHPEFQTMARSPRVLDALEEVLGPDIFLYENSLVYKPKGKNNEVPWHQDYMNRPDEPRKYVVWMALDNVRRENGAMTVIPGSHKNGFLPWFKVEGETHHTRLKLDDINVDEFEYAEMDAGDVLIFNQLLIHGSKRISSREPRRAFRVAYQGFEEVFTPRSVPVVVRGGHPDSLAKRYPQKFDVESLKLKKNGPVRWFLHGVGKRLQKF
ncbi:MAG: phytanoyl-CoA dioxygenase family protein [Bacteroidota bacterium]